MRFRHQDQNLEISVVTGTHTGLLSFDMPKAKTRDLLGFAIERLEHKTNRRYWLEGLKCFKSLVAQPRRGDSYASNIHPLQTFFWMDYTLKPNEQYTYQIIPMYGPSPLQLSFGPSTQITIETEPFSSKNDKHEVYFNRGVSGSQYYSNRFGTSKLDKLSEKDQQLALQWLQSGLFDGFLHFINTAKSGEKLLGAFYEFKHPNAVAALKNAAEKGVEVKITCDGTAGYKDENMHTVQQLQAEALLNIKYRKVSGLKIPHNKFLVHCDRNGKPVKIWTGSTNISEKAFFGHCNTGHVIKDKSVAAQYLAFWEKLYSNAEMKDLKAFNLQVEPDLAPGNALSKEMYTFFSPRKNSNLLKYYAGLMNQAKQVVCAVFPFNVDESLRTVFEEDKDYLRFVIIDKRSRYNKINRIDPDLKVTYGGVVNLPVYQWSKEVSAGGVFYSGVNFVHNKFILIDPLSDNPIVISGSANFSKPSLTGNDENTLIIQGNKRIADIYLTEHTRLYSHFYFRDFLKNNPRSATIFDPFLKEDDSWIKDYYEPNDFSFKRKKLLKEMSL